jgi:hypothetical protein
MPTPRKDATERVLHYLSELPEWSRNLCSRLREIILQADPSLTEDWKWGPNYNSNGMVCGFGAFQKHVKLTFFNGSAMSDSGGLFNHCTDNEFLRSIKYTSVEQLDPEKLKQYVRESAAINAKGFKKVIKDKTVTVPEDLQQALEGHPSAATFFGSLSYGYRKDFVEHVTGAKTEATREKRIAKVVEHCTNGIRLNDQYKK